MYVWRGSNIDKVEKVGKIHSSSRFGNNARRTAEVGYGGAVDQMRRVLRRTAGMEREHTYQVGFE